MRRFTKLTFFCIAMIMVLQIFLPTMSYAIENIKLNIQYERPYSDDNGDGTEGNDIYTIIREAIQTVFKIGEQKQTGLDFNSDYYCLRAGLGFGSTDSILESGLNYTKLSELQSKDSIKQYYEQKIGYELTDANYSAICWIVDNMYLPKAENASKLKEKLLSDAGINLSQLTNDDIEVIQQVALWYFANYDTNGDSNSLSLFKNVDLANLLQINETQPSNNTEVAYNKIRAEQINKLYNYFIESAEKATNYSIKENTLELSFEETNPTIIQRENTYMVGPYRINKNGNVDCKIEYECEINGIVYSKENIKIVDQNGNDLGNNIINTDFYVQISNRNESINKFKLNVTYHYDYYNTQATVWKAVDGEGNPAQPVLKVEKIREKGDPQISKEIKSGYCNIKIVKVDSETEKVLPGASFSINGDSLGTTGDNGVITTADIKISKAGEQLFTIKETTAPENYKLLINDPITLKIVTEEKDDGFEVTGATLTEENENVDVSISGTTIIIKVKNERIKEFDLSLRKYITKVNGEEVANTRIPNIDTSKLENGTNTTANYAHRKDPVEVKSGDIVTYNMTIYNEGEIDGRATKVVDQLPAGLEFVSVENGNYEVESYDKQTNKLTLKETAENTNLAAFASGNLASTTVTINCKVVVATSIENKVLTNIAWIAEDFNADNNEIKDRDSKPEVAPTETADNLVTTNIGYTGKDSYSREELANPERYIEGQQDDDDFEKIVVATKNFDLSLRKFISNIERQGENVAFDSREPQVDTTTLRQGVKNEKGEIEYTATYTHPKDSIIVKQGDIVTYTIRTYNEGELDGYVTEITDYLPDGLGLLYGENVNSNWSFKNNEVNDPVTLAKWYEEKGKNLPTTGLLKDEDLEDVIIVTAKDNKNLVINNSLDVKEQKINKYDTKTDKLDYIDITVTCIVLAPNTFDGKLVNIAEVSNYQAVDENGNNISVLDRDSIPFNANLEEYELKTQNSTYQEDDDDYEPIELRYFDLALRKFITGVNKEEITSREPNYKDENGKILTDKDGNIVYEHTKDPVEVVDKDIVTYTLRVYNEGSIAGFAEEIEDDIPEGLIFLPENETNSEYRWKMYYYDEDGKLTETDKVEKAEVIRTDYLSKANGKIDEETKINSNLLKPFDGNTLEYRDIKVAFKVSQANIPESNKDKIIINKAHITKDSDDDEDSIPDKWNDGEDDQDIEKIHVQEFDLALFKWVTETKVTVDGKTTVTETGFKPNVGETEAPYKENSGYRSNEEKEPIASVTIDKKKLSKTVVKFTYNIKVVNEGDIAGFATEITDYIPEGLAFVGEDNPLWTIGEKDGTISTRALETVLLKPGESATIPVVFTWINNANNLGLKANIAAITEDHNDKNVKDIDSITGNEDITDYNKEQEDDDDYALVILTLKTGSQISYWGIALVFITIIATGIITIKKYVL